MVKSTRRAWRSGRRLSRESPGPERPGQEATRESCVSVGARKVAVSRVARELGAQENCGLRSRRRAWGAGKLRARESPESLGPREFAGSGVAGEPGAQESCGLGSRRDLTVRKSSPLSFRFFGGLLHVIDNELPAHVACRHENVRTIPGIRSKVEPEPIWGDAAGHARRYLHALAVLQFSIGGSQNAAGAARYRCAVRANGPPLSRARLWSTVAQPETWWLHEACAPVLGDLNDR